MSDDAMKAWGQLTIEEHMLLKLNALLGGRHDDCECIPLEEVTQRLCALCARVMREQFDCHLPADCFCPDGPKDPYSGYRFGADILTFIEKAVEDAIQARVKP